MPKKQCESKLTLGVMHGGFAWIVQCAYPKGHSGQHSTTEVWRRQNKIVRISWEKIDAKEIKKV